MLPLLLLYLLTITVTATNQDHFTKYKYLDYNQIITKLHSFQTQHPNQIYELDNVQSKYNVNTPGTCSNAASDMSGIITPCKQWYVTITGNTKTKDNQSQKQTSSLPEVFFSGSVHGNERVGPTTTMECLDLLLNNNKSPLNNNNVNSKWLLRLLHTRLITVMPTANALGYYQNVREENDVDPNRDFPWGVQSNECMRTTAARAINELYRDHLFRLAITFHGGMRAIAYEWGSPNYKDKSPDNQALQPLGKGAQQAAGQGDGKNDGYYYPASWLNPLVYPVKGGMEDWAYAASFDKTGYNKPCVPTEYNGYPKEKTMYTKDQLRTFNFLVETAEDKTPNEETLGSKSNNLNSLEFLNETNAADGEQTGGHIPRNVRLMLYMIDMAEPYIEWYDTTNSNTASNGKIDIASLSTLRWDVGGALQVDDTALFLIPWLNMKNNECPINIYDLDFSNTQRINVQDMHQIGDTIWTRKENKENEENKLVHFVGKYSACIEKNVLNDKSSFIIVAGAKVDQSWADIDYEAEPNGMEPQSHLVQSRTRDGYKASNNGHVIHGHVWWYSTPKCVRNGIVSTSNVINGDNREHDDDDANWKTDITEAELPVDSRYNTIDKYTAATKEYQRLVNLNIMNQLAKEKVKKKKEQDGNSMLRKQN